MKKVIMLLSGPCDDRLDPDPRVENEAEALAEAGYNVRIFAWDRELKSKRVEKKKRFIIERIRIKSTFGRGFRQIFAFLHFNYILFCKLMKTDFDIVHCHDFDTLIPGFKVAKLKRKKLVFDSHEYYPAMMIDQGMKRLSKLAEKLQSFIAKRAGLIIVVNPVLKRIFNKLNQNVQLVMNCKKLIDFRNLKSIDIIKKYKLGNKKIFLYIGAFSPGRNLIELIDIFKNKVNAVLLLGGKGYLEEKIRNKIKNNKNVIYLGPIKLKDVPRYTLASDFLLAIYKSTLLNNDIAGPPNKLFEAIAATKPIITSNQGSTAELMKKIGCGLVVNPDSKTEINKAVNELLSNKLLRKKLTNNAKKAKKIFNWENESKKLVIVYKNL